jgi:pyridoxine 4-dehydrogenase
VLGASYRKRGEKAFIKAFACELPEEERDIRMTRTLGKAGPPVSSNGLGAMGMSDFYGPADRTESIATIRAALNAGVNLIDTGDFYGSGHNGMLTREALAGINREDFVLSVKFGALRDPSGGKVGIDTSAAHIKNYLAQSLQRLGTSLHRYLSPRAP